MTGADTRRYGHLLTRVPIQPQDFPEPTAINPGRPAQCYSVMQDASFYKCLGNTAAEQVREDPQPSPPPADVFLPSVVRPPDGQGGLPDPRYQAGPWKAWHDWPHLYGNVRRRLRHVRRRARSPLVLADVAPGRGECEAVVILG